MENVIHIDNPQEFINKCDERVDELKKQLKKSDIVNNVDFKLKNFVENIEKLEQEKKELSLEIGGIYKLAKHYGFNIKAIKRIVSLRKIETDERVDIERAIELYKQSLGME